MIVDFEHVMPAGIVNIFVIAIKFTRTVKTMTSILLKISISTTVEKNAVTSCHQRHSIKKMYSGLRHATLLKRDPGTGLCFPVNFENF